jgi:tetratricopeptide (TPR) repeat protein
MNVVYIEGDPGIGKTRLLQEIPILVQGSNVRLVSIIDFYDSAMHSYSAVEEVIAHSLGREWFKKFWEIRQTFERKRIIGELAIGEFARELDKQRLEVWKAFKDDYNCLATREDVNRIVLCFDTVESLEYEYDAPEVVEDCEIKLEEAPSWGWLLSRVQELKNTTVFIGGRPSGRIREDLAKTYGPSFKHVELRGFTREEVKVYCEARIKDKLEDEMVNRIHILTDGRPIVVSLAIDWWLHGIWDDALYPVDPADLLAKRILAEQEERSGQSGDAWEKWQDIKQRFEIALVQRFHHLGEPRNKAIFCASLARKGFNAELLAHMMNMPLSEAERLEAELLDLSFIKHSRLGQRDLLFLHDEMYELVERYVGRAEWPDYKEQEGLLRLIVEWYDAEIKTIAEKIKQAKNLEQRIALRRTQQLLLVEWLYYQYDLDPRKGYAEFSHLSEEAIHSREFGWEGRLRVETLRFLRQRAWRAQQGGLVKISAEGQVSIASHINRDCRRRWIERYTSHGCYEQAIDIAEKLIRKYHDAPLWWQGGMRIALATAQAYIGGEFARKAIKNFQKGIHDLESASKEYRGHWLYLYLLGTGYLYQGLALRNFLRLDEAARAYGQAITYYRQAQYLPGLAEALNNLSYVYARQGRLGVARPACDEGLGIRQELGDEYAIGLSLNTKGIINERMNRPLAAIQHSEQALALFREIGNERGIILAEINLGRSYRRKARSSEWGGQDEDFKKGEAYLKDAISKQQGLEAGAETFYRVEAYNELGCLYRDWVATLHEKGEQKEERLQQYLGEAERNLKMAIQLTGIQNGQVSLSPHLSQYIDSLEDLARVHYWRTRLGFLCQDGDPLRIARDQLEEAERLTRKYLSRSAEMHLILGKVYTQRARLVLQQRDGENREATAAHYYALAAGHIERYSLDAAELLKTVSDSCLWLNTLESGKVQLLVEEMHSTLKAERLKSQRLKEWVNSVLYPRLGVRWPRARG